MKPTKEQLEAYKAMAKEGAVASMEAQIRENLVKTCDKFAGNEDKFDRCIAYLNDCAREILESRNGDVPDEVCYRICRDYFNDEVWKKEDEEKAAKEAKRKADKEKLDKIRSEKKAKKPVKKTASQVEKESLGKEKQRIEKLKEKHGCKPAEKEKTCKADEEAKKVELEKMQAEAAREAEALKKAEEKKINDKIRAQIAEKNKELGIGMAQPIDMFAEAV